MKREMRSKFKMIKSKQCKVIIKTDTMEIPIGIATLEFEYIRGLFSEPNELAFIRLNKLTLHNKKGDVLIEK